MVDYSQTRKFLDAIHNNDKTTFMFLCEDGSGKSTHKSYESFNEKSIDYYNTSGYAAFYMVNSSFSKSTLDKDVSQANAVFIDIDNGDLPTYFPLEPSVISSREDGKGHHVYWFISPTNDLDSWVSTMNILINFYGSDKSIKNPSRLMRLPGTINNKKGKDYKGNRYNIASFNEHYYDIKTVISSHQDKSSLLIAIRRYAKTLFKDHDPDIEGGDHYSMYKIAAKMNGYGFNQDEILDELMSVSKLYCNDLYDRETLAKKAAAGEKYGQKAKGAEGADEYLKDQARQKVFAKLLDDWWYVKKEKLFINTKNTDETYDKEGFNDEFLHQCPVKKQPVTYVMENNLVKKAYTAAYKPGAPISIEGEDGLKHVNMWKDDRVKPDDTDPQFFIDHINYLLPNKEDSSRFLDWLAFQIQNPCGKVNHAFLIIGGQGIGKSILWRIFKPLFGQSNYTEPDNNTLAGDFSGWSKNKRFVLINELKQEYNVHFYNKIKPYITDHLVPIREMYREAYTIDNYVNILAFSNEEIPIRLEDDDRRWYVAKSNARPRDEDYYDSLEDNCTSNIGGVYRLLLERDISHFRPGRRPAMTEAKKIMMEYSKSDYEMYVREVFAAKTDGYENDIVCVRDIVANLPFEYRNDKNCGTRRTNVILMKLGAIKIDKKIRVNGPGKDFFIIRNKEKYMSDFDNINAIVKDMYKEDSVTTFQ